ncbi:PASTA domain-containing protein [Streptomyces sp. NPDC002766]|uniref:PASTA domain-containing protein n=1 Tax=unclassified Streptomyces TaxID=2593676 RepID=UPI003317BBFD
MTWIGPSNADEVTVPDVVGLIVTQARAVAWQAGLVVAADDPDGPPVGALTWPGVWVVTAQHPAPGSRMRRRGSLVIYFKELPGGNAGDREPRRPLPYPDGLTAELDPEAGPDQPGERLWPPH